MMEPPLDTQCEAIMCPSVLVEIKISHPNLAPIQRAGAL